MADRRDKTIVNGTESVQSNHEECRTCLQNIKLGATMFSLFSTWTGPCSIIADDLGKLANIEVSQTDELPKQICEPCYRKLKQACEFTAMVQVNNDILNQRYTTDVKTEWPKPIQLNSCIIDNMDLEIKQEILSEDDMNPIEEYHHEKEDLNSVEIKVEPEELSSVQPIKITVNGTISLNEYQSADPLSNGIDSNDCYNDEERLESIKKEPTSEEEESAPFHLPLECLLCLRSFKSVSGLKAHVIAQHSYKSVRRKTPSSNASSPLKKQHNFNHTCTTCGRKFSTSTDLMVHETCHKKMACYGCSMKFASFEELSEHRLVCEASGSEPPRHRTLEDALRHQTNTIRGEDNENPKDPLYCTICNEKFLDNYYMKIHQEIHHTTESDTVNKIVEQSVVETRETLESMFSSDK